ncbi:nucleoside diphosphate kinase regulator [Bdellovibrio svalbardensis]|uniref:Nucleoside diphosphate kinase regulator n=1 Tax=Bdellovibrio svalbardensis TaxID=2972972 RepID=A0ABT6DGT1_9BACT|nr:nucleoside diphosphate kinase regulator [Bdellovibrio svalbardensis]MDG0816071.1 nucleoside diphosphate kinase regulator [Bdellovibrio svalbardensis]
MESQSRIFVTDLDYQRLSSLAAQTESDTGLALEEELSRANVIAQKDIPANVVTMNSRVRFVDEVTGQEQEMTLVYPKDANLEKGQISILAPIGVALLGLSVGQSIDWKLPNGAVKKLKVKEVLFQPESQGNFDL